MFWFLSLLVSLILGCIVWRLLCRKFNIPWPYWLAWWLENPYMLIFCHPTRVSGFCGIQAGMMVAELGCGAGRVTPYLARKSFPGIVYAIDFQKGMLSLLGRRIQKEKIENVQVYEIDLKLESLPKKGLDRVVITTVLGEIPGYCIVLQKVFEALKEGGIVSITEVIPDPCYITSKTLRGQCEDIGFQHRDTFHNVVSYTMNLEKPCT